MPSIFQVFSGIYDFITANPFWEEAIDRLVDAAGPLPPAPRVLDLGCGPGVSAFRIARRLGPGTSVTGIDTAPAMVRRARTALARLHADMANVTFMVADATRLPFPDASFDLATGHSFLYIVPDRPAVLREVRRVLAPGGVLALMEPDAGGNLVRAASRARVRDATRHVTGAMRFAGSMVSWRIYSSGKGQMRREEVERLFDDAGFSEVSISSTLGGLGMHVRGRKA